MPNAVHLSRILIYPVKSLDAVEVQQVRMTSGGILENDRVWVIRDSAGKFVNAKRDARVQRLRSVFSSDFREVALWETGCSTREHFVLKEFERLNIWLSDYFGFTVHLKKEPTRGFPDDDEAYGPTIICETSLITVSSWFGLTVESVRRRFRTNLELSNAPAFYEDLLFGAPDERRPFKLGDVHFLGHNPCQRCIVPTRDPDSAEAVAGFQKRFAELRREELPLWADVRRFNHFYRFALNTSVPPSEGGKMLYTGDVLRLNDSV